MAASTHFGHNVLDLQGYARLLAVGALVAPLEQQILFELIARQGAVLVFRSRDLGMLQGLGIEARCLIRKCANRAPPPQARYPGLDIAHATDERGGKPAFGLPSIEEARLAVSRMPLAPSPARGRPLLEGLMHLLAAMGEFRRPEHFSRRIVRHRQAAGAAARVYLEA